MCHNNVIITYAAQFHTITHHNGIQGKITDKNMLIFTLKWHRFFMILTWSMTIAAFVIIFVELGEWSSETIHASLGLATTILAFIQPFMAATRPHPGAPRRPLFNWAHWFVGNAAQICGSKFLLFFFF